MARLKLIEYLNDPSLLRTISEEEMLAWAAEVPYAGLVQRLLAQKLAIESSDKQLADSATTMAILSNANPDQVIRSIEDFKRMVLAGNEEAENSKEIDQPAQEEPEKEQGHGITDYGEGEEGSLLNQQELESSLKSKDDQTHENVVPDSLIKSDTVSSEEITESSGIDQLSAFSNWLSKLQPIDSLSKEEATFELEHKELASDALAELLVSQGHIARAIEMYEILMLKNPQKSPFFADQIKKLKAL